jgi:uncharacterized membrane protein
MIDIISLKQELKLLLSGFRRPFLISHTESPYKNNITKIMKKKILSVVALIGVFTLGMYTASQFVFGTPVDTHRWLITTLAIVILLSLADDTEKK